MAHPEGLTAVPGPPAWLPPAWVPLGPEPPPPLGEKGPLSSCSVNSSKLNSLDSNDLFKPVVYYSPKAGDDFLALTLLSQVKPAEKNSSTFAFYGNDRYFSKVISREL